MLRVVTFRVLLLLTVSLPLESVAAVPGSASLTKLLGVFAGGMWAITVVTNGRVRKPHALHVVALLFVLWNGCSMLWTIDGPATQTRTLTYAQLLVLLLVVWETVTTTARLRQVLLANLIGCYVAALATVVGYVLRGSAAEVHGRVTLGSFNPNDAGAILAFGLPVACYFVAAPTVARRRLILVLAATYLPLGSFAVLATGSRAALIAVVPAAWYACRMLWQRHPAAGLATSLALAGLVVGALPLLPGRAVQRLGETGSDVMQGNLNERQDVWAEAFRIIHDHPVTGIGAGAFRTAAVSVNKVGHNFVLALLAEVGIVGFVLFALMIVVAVRALRPASRKLRELWYALFAAWMCTALLHNWEYRKLTWLFYGLMVVTGAVARGPSEDQDLQPADREAGVADRS